jgi:perosamine synthetase
VNQVTPTLAPPAQAVLPRPKGPVFGWASFQRENAPNIPSVEDLPHIAFTTSGRAAIFQALLQLELPPGSTVLVPTYHCPTMVAPVLLAGHQPAYFGIRKDGLPDVLNIAPTVDLRARAMIVSHYFGLAQSLHEVREWCDRRGIALIEDCAHCYFGQAGERPIGAWGDYCTASLSKFFPVPEAGLLGSAMHAIKPLGLHRQGLKAQAKGWVDVLETAAKYRRVAGLNNVLEAVFRLKRGTRGAENSRSSPEPISADTVMKSCDMARIRHQPLGASMLLRMALPRGRIIAQRQRNFSLYSDILSNLSGATALAALPTKPVAPYVYPLWVEDADRVYHGLRAEGIPVFRWDALWPGTPHLDHDVGGSWSRQVLQLLCHQDLCEQDIRYSAGRLAALLNTEPPVPRNNPHLQEKEPCPS